MTFLVSRYVRGKLKSELQKAADAGDVWSPAALQWIPVAEQGLDLGSRALSRDWPHPNAWRVLGDTFRGACYAVAEAQDVWEGTSDGQTVAPSV